MSFNPSVILEGRAVQLAGPLIAADGEKPCFAQLLVHDPVLENNMRFQNMTIPVTMSKSHRNILKKTLEKVQTELKKYNPFIKDFTQIIEIPAEDLCQGKIVISAKNRPIGEHARRYNEQLNLKEVRILTNSEPHDLVLQQ